MIHSARIAEILGGVLSAAAFATKLATKLAAALAFATSAAAAEQHSSNALVTQAHELELAKTVEWRRLVHYFPSSRSPSGIESHVDDERFFLADDGKTNPQSELDSSIVQLLSSDHASLVSNDESPRCRFVAREQWLRNKLDLTEIPVPTYCTKFQDWLQRVKPHTVTLIFPASFINSPSSMFGHTLLRIDPENIDSNSDWLSWSLNFAADVGEDDSLTAGYAFKGIAGAYDGKFHSVP